MIMRTTSHESCSWHRQKSHRSGGGFTILELMIVVALIAIIAAIAIPTILEARIAANEASAISTLRTITSVNMQYRTRFSSFASGLSDLYTTGYVDPSVANPFKAGYTFTYSSGSPQSYAVTADPTNPAESGNRYFFVDTSGVIRFSYSATATLSDTPI